jgi:hypothetical protein
MTKFVLSNTLREIRKAIRNKQTLKVRRIIGTGLRNKTTSAYQRKQLKLMYNAENIHNISRIVTTLCIKYKVA